METVATIWMVAFAIWCVSAGAVPHQQRIRRRGRAARRQDVRHGHVHVRWRTGQHRVLRGWIMKSHLVGFRRTDAQPRSSRTEKSIERREDLRDRVYEQYELKREQEPPHRRYLGASDIHGHGGCERSLSYVFRWAKRKSVPGRLGRLFARGHREEPELENDLRSIGIPITTVGKDGGQHNFTSPDGHVRVHLDGIIDLDGEPALIEMKTSSEAKFDDLDAKGVKRTKPEHYDQMQLQMLMAKEATGAAKCLYVAVCKNTDRLHFEVVREDPKRQKEIWEKAGRVVNGEVAEPLSGDITKWPCHYCDFVNICRANLKGDIEVNCRSCAHAKPVEGARWTCTAGRPWGTPCNQWMSHPDL